MNCICRINFLIPFFRDVMDLIQERIASSRNMALFINANQSITLQGIKLHLFMPSGSVIHGATLFDENIFSVVQELTYKYKFQGKQIYYFRPDIVLFINGLYLGYSELKSNYTHQSARKNGRGKVIKDYFEAVKMYHQYIDSNALLSDSEKLACRRHSMLKRRSIQPATHLKAPVLRYQILFEPNSCGREKLSNM